MPPWTPPRRPRCSCPRWWPSRWPPARSACSPAQGRCIGVTHPDDLALVQAELNRQVAAGERPARLWASRLSRSADAPGRPAAWARTDTRERSSGPGPDATQPRVTVRPKPPVLLGATSSMDRWHRAGVVSDNPRPSRPRRLQGSHRDAPRTISVGSSCPLQSRSPCGARSLSSIPPCSVLSASPRSALRLPFGLPSLPPFGARLRFGGLLSPNWGQVAPRVTRGQWRFAKSRRSPHLSPTSSPSGAAPVPSSSPCRRAREHRLVADRAAS